MRLRHRRVTTEVVLIDQNMAPIPVPLRFHNHRRCAFHTHNEGTRRAVAATALRNVVQLTSTRFSPGSSPLIKWHHSTKMTAATNHASEELNTCLSRLVRDLSQRYWHSEDCVGLHPRFVLTLNSDCLFGEACRSMQSSRNAQQGINLTVMGRGYSFL